MNNQLAVRSNQTFVVGAQWDSSKALTKPTPKTLTNDKHSRFYEFTFWLTERQEQAIIQKWAALADRIDILSIELIEQLRRDPHTFYDSIDSNHELYDNLEVVALYAARPDDRTYENHLSVYELSNLLQFKSACTRWGRDQVNVHLLKTPNGQSNQKAVDVFLSSIKDLPASPDWKDGKAPYDANTIPWYLPAHQLMFMTAPAPADTSNTIFTQLSENILKGLTFTMDGNEKRRFIVTQQLLDGFLHIIYPHNPSSSLPIIGDAQSDDFTDFKRRPVAIPCSFAPPPKVADGHAVESAEDFHVHDVYHVFIDKANPFLMAFQELLDKKVIEALPYAKETLNKTNVTFYELYLDREYGTNIQHSHLAKDTQFWLCMMSMFQRYAGFLKKIFNEDMAKTSEELEKGMRIVIDYIGVNRKRWKNDYGVNLTSLRTMYYFDKCTKGHTLGLNFPFYKDCIRMMKEQSFKYFAEEEVASNMTPGTTFNVLDDDGNVIGTRIAVNKDVVKTNIIPGTTFNVLDNNGNVIGSRITFN